MSTGSKLHMLTRAAIAAAALGVAASASAANAPGGAELLFGLSAPFSGTEKEFGRQLRAGWEIAFAAQNEAGGVHGRRLKLLPMDDGYDPPRALAAMKELVENRKVFGIVGSFGTATAAAAVPYTNDAGVIYFGAYSGAKLLRNDPPDRYVFNVRASYAEETAAIVSYLVESRRIPPQAIAVFAQEDAFGDSGMDGVARVMRRFRRNPAEVLRVGYKRNSTDVDAAVERVKSYGKHLKAIVMIATPQPGARFVERARDAGLDLLFTAVSTGGNDLAGELAALGPKYAEGVLMTQVVPLPGAAGAAVAKYGELLRKYAPGETPHLVSLEAYLSARVLIEGLQRAGRDLTVDRLIDALEAMQSFDLGIGMPLSFGPSEHQASHKVWGTVLDARGNLKALEME